ncbi:lipoprotein signal peptidase [Dyadobacter subterraneus]|uniref:Lipoprotein signal peptidase n=1 Tax=Dyadobacter subterraneus TaxID=2773304 RepID=A0ABR9WIG3_9BACT|nr:lipoprotein signal peptidase [Dyadobacter subterraneus]MBE9465312.1 lipoprotein signal peptidase [Dyadobacter subterraneus]
MNQPKNPVRYLLFSVLLIAVDQLSKLLVFKYMQPGFSGQILLAGNWLKLHYVLNPGMAFGMQLGHEYGKLFLTLFRLLAMCAIAWYLVHLARNGASKGLLWALSMILAGAVGNVIDSTFYGVFLDNAPYGSPTPWFHGQVIDMIFVDFWEGFIPEWVPVWGGQYYSTPIFNIADSCIFLGVCSILIFQGHFYTPADEEVKPEETTHNHEDAESLTEPHSFDEVAKTPGIPVEVLNENENLDIDSSRNLSASMLNLDSGEILESEEVISPTINPEFEEIKQNESVDIDSTQDISSSMINLENEELTKPGESTTEK